MEEVVITEGQGKTMSRDQKKHCLVLLVLVIAIALVLPIVFGEPRSIKDQTGGNGWRNFVFDFQTLITGVLAIGAAYFTIRSSQKIDKEAERRHHELVGLTLRADRLRVDRLLHPAFETLVSHYEDIKGVDIPLLKEMITDGEPRAVREVLESMDVDIWSVKRILNSSPFSETTDLFDGPLNYQYEVMGRLADAIRTEVSNCIASCDRLFSALKRDLPDLKEVAEGETLRSLDSISKYRKDYLNNYGDFLESLGDMRREYRIQ